MEEKEKNISAGGKEIEVKGLGFFLKWFMPN